MFKQIGLPYSILSKLALWTQYSTQHESMFEHIFGSGELYEPNFPNCMLGVTIFCCLNPAYAWLPFFGYNAKPDILLFNQYSHFIYKPCFSGYPHVRISSCIEPKIVYMLIKYIIYFFFASSKKNST